jgi:hypothetical protein
MTTDGDMLGNADVLGPDETSVPGWRALLTPETCAISGAGLVLGSFMTGAPTEVLQLGLFNAIDGHDPQVLWLVAPGALLALGGMALGAVGRRSPMSPAMTGLSGAAVLVGGALVALFVIGYLRLLL